MLEVGSVAFWFAAMQTWRRDGLAGGRSRSSGLRMTRSSLLDFLRAVALASRGGGRCGRRGCRRPRLRLSEATQDHVGGFAGAAGDGTSSPVSAYLVVEVREFACRAWMDWPCCEKSRVRMRASSSGRVACHRCGWGARNSSADHVDADVGALAERMVATRSCPGAVREAHSTLVGFVEGSRMRRCGRGKWAAVLRH